MKQGIIVVTWSGGEESCTLLLNSLRGVKYPVLIVLNDFTNAPPSWIEKLHEFKEEQGWDFIEHSWDGFEIGAISAALKYTDWEEMFVLQDTFEIKNQDIFSRVFEEYAGKSVAYNPYYQMYLLKFRREILNQIEIPEVRSKRESVRQEEVFTTAYRQKEPDMPILNPMFRDDTYYGNWEERFGRKNLKMEDDYFIKRKGTWSADQLPPEG